MALDGTVYAASTVEGVAVVSGISRRGTSRCVIPTGGPVWGMAITPDGKKVFLAMSNAGVRRISTGSGHLTPLTDRVCPEHLALDPVSDCL